MGGILVCDLGYSGTPQGKSQGWPIGGKSDAGAFGAAS